MSTEITKTTNGGALVSADSNPFLVYGENERQTSIVGKLLKFTKGDWSAGMDDTPIEDGQKFVANMDELLIGWIRWQDFKPTDHIMGKVVKNFQPPLRSELGDSDPAAWDVDESGKARDPWQKSNYLLLQGDIGDGPELFTFTTSSTGGRNAVSDLSIKYGKVLRQRAKEYPVIAIGNGSYQHSNKAYGRIKYPTFTITGWVPKTGFADIHEMERLDEIEAPVEMIEAMPPTQPAKAKPAGRGKGRF